MSLLGSVPHHAETLNVSVAHYSKLIDAVALVVRRTIPVENTIEIQSWDDVTQNLHQVVRLASEEIHSSKLDSFV